MSAIHTYPTDHYDTIFSIVIPLLNTTVEQEKDGSIQPSVESLLHGEHVEKIRFDRGIFNLTTDVVIIQGKPFLKIENNDGPINWNAVKDLLLNTKYYLPKFRIQFANSLDLVSTRVPVVLGVGVVDVDLQNDVFSVQFGDESPVIADSDIPVGDQISGAPVYIKASDIPGFDLEAFLSNKK